MTLRSIFKKEMPSLQPLKDVPLDFTSHAYNFLSHMTISWSWLMPEKAIANHQYPQREVNLHVFLDPMLGII